MAKPLLPTAYVNFKDGQLPKGPLPSGIAVFIGVGDGSATMGAITPINSPNDIQTLFGTGPLARDLTTAFLEGIGFAYAIQVAGSTAGTIGTASIGGFTAGALAGTVKNAYQVRVKPYLAGALGVAQVQYSLDGGSTWGDPRVLVSGANAVVGPNGFDCGLTFSTTVTTVTLALTNFSCDTVAPLPADADVTTAMDTAIQDASLFFNYFHIGVRKDTDANLKTFLQAIATKLDDAVVTWFKHVYAIVPGALSAATAAGALTEAQYLRANFAHNRVQVGLSTAILKSIGGRYAMSISPIIAARRAQLEPQNDLGIVRAGGLNSVVSFATGWTDATVTALDQIKNCVTIRRHVGAAGFYFTGDWMTDPTSDYKKSCLRLVADLVAADCRTAAIPFVKMDIDPADVSGSAEVLLQACRAPLKVRTNNKQISKAILSVPENQDILTTEELVIEVALIPMGTASWIRFNLGFKSPFAGG